MTSFDDLYKAAVKKRPAPQLLCGEDVITYYALKGIYTELQERKIQPQKATAAKLYVRRYYEQVDLTHGKAVAEYQRLQDSATAAREEINELMESIAPGADPEQLLLKAMGVISHLVGMDSAVYQRTAEHRLHGVLPLSQVKSMTQQKASCADKFDEFYKAYPRHVGKQDAVKAFGKLNPGAELFGKIMRSLEEWKKCAQWRDSERIPSPATWLNGRRFEDEPNEHTSGQSKEAPSYDLSAFEQQSLHGKLEYKKRA